jgi:hypothetical protein
LNFLNVFISSSVSSGENIPSVQKNTVSNFLKSTAVSRAVTASVPLRNLDVTVSKYLSDILRFITTPSELNSARVNLASVEIL